MELEGSNMDQEKGWGSGTRDAVTKMCTILIKGHLAENSGQ
jgi:hypothetical protein